MTWEQQMDPIAALSWIKDAIDDGDFDLATERADDLREWQVKGGFIDAEAIVKAREIVDLLNRIDDVPLGLLALMVIILADSSVAQLRTTRPKHRFKIRIVEELLTVGFADISIEAETPLAAAKTILDAWKQASERSDKADSFEEPLAKLPDGQEFTLDPTQHSMDTRCFCVLVDGDGREIMQLGEVPPPLSSSTKDRDGLVQMIKTIIPGDLQ